MLKKGGSLVKSEEARNVEKAKVGDPRGPKATEAIG